MESSKFSNASQKHDRQAEVTPDIGNINFIIHTSSKSNEHESEVAPTEKLEKEESRNVSAGTVSQSSKSSNTSSKSKIHHHQTEVAPAKQLQRGNSEDVFTGTDYKDLPSSNSSKFSNTSSKSKIHKHQTEVAPAKQFQRGNSEDVSNGTDFKDSLPFIFSNTSSESKKHDHQAEVPPDIGNINVIIHTSSKSKEHDQKSAVAPREKLEKKGSKNVSTGTVLPSSKSSKFSTDYQDLPSSNSSKFSNTSSKSKKYDHQIEVALAEQFPREKSEHISNGTDYSYKDSLSSLFDTLFNSSSKSNHDQQAGVAPGEKLENVSTVTDNMGYLQSFAFEFFNTSPKSKKHDQQPEVGPEDNGNIHFIKQNSHKCKTEFSYYIDTLRAILNSVQHEHNICLP